jgi:WD repeat-containing protein 37
MLLQGTLPLEPESDDPDCDDKTEPPTLRTPRFELKGHSNVVIAADWLFGGDQVITASWDRTVCLFDANTGESLHSLPGVHSFFSSMSDLWGDNNLI